MSDSPGVAPQTPTAPLSTPSAHTITAGGKTLTLAEAETAVRSSGSWFWWIAALSLVNSVSSMLNLKYGMVIGLGATQIIDALFLLSPDGEPSPDISLLARAIHLAFVAGAAGCFYVLGARARAMSHRAFKVGMIAYALDGVLSALFADWIGLGFHAFVLFWLWSGYSITKALQAAHSGPAVA